MGNKIQNILYLDIFWGDGQSIWKMVFNRPNNKPIWAWWLFPTPFHTVGEKRQKVCAARLPTVKASQPHFNVILLPLVCPQMGFKWSRHSSTVQIFLVWSTPLINGGNFPLMVNEGKQSESLPFLGFLSLFWPQLLKGIKLKYKVWYHSTALELLYRMV